MSFSKENTQVKCTRCRNTHFESERVSKRDPKYKVIPTFTQLCPRCGCKSFYDLTPQFAWCWASGLIEIGDCPPSSEPDGSGAIMFATGPKYALKGFLDVVARHGKGDSTGKLLVPGVPEAPDSDMALDALMSWLAWCEQRKGAQRDGIKISLVEGD
ncbi:hypothetical protein [Lonsdalea britannica]|uniref:hypothetical protein n=1 Tax=Lonsdalea britannica TaxID=1082704 RepID=UPI0026F3589D|nr:hypothetical protein [Lonsdalea britannica]